MRFDFATAGHIVFGPGVVDQVPSLACRLGRHALLVGGRDRARGDDLESALQTAGLRVVRFVVRGEPTVDMVREAVEITCDSGCDMVIAMGGGSSLDAGKAVAALTANGGDPLDYLEVIGRGRPLHRDPLPFVAIPTTAGTGSEVTRNAVLSAPARRMKASLRSPRMLPRLAVVDPLLARSLPPDVTAATGLDALTQLIEPYVCNRPDSLVDALCLEGMRRAARSLERACQDGEDPIAREDMALASLLGGMALANARLGAIHGFAAPLGGLFAAPHGALCARLLPFVMRVNHRALSSRDPGHPARIRYQEIARLLTGHPEATPDDGADWVARLAQRLGIAPLASYGIGRQDFALIIEKACAASSMQGNPIRLTEEELSEILEQALT